MSDYDAGAFDAFEAAGWGSEGSVRVSPLVRSQSEEMQRAIRGRFEELLDEYRTDDGFDVPVAVKLAGGRKP